MLIPVYREAIAMSRLIFVSDTKKPTKANLVGFRVIKVETTPKSHLLYKTVLTRLKPWINLLSTNSLRRAIGKSALLRFLYWIANTSVITAYSTFHLPPKAANFQSAIFNQTSPPFES